MYAGGAGVPVEAGTWQQLTVASHSRYLPVAQDTMATDSATPVTATYIPFKAWQSPFLSDDGKLYYFGGMHSDYPGNDIDMCDLAAMGAGTSMPWTQLHRPRVPPAGDGGYGSGGSEALYKNYTPALSDKTDWQPYARHYYTGATVHPVYGLLMKAMYPVDPATGVYSTTTWHGTGFPKSSVTHFGPSDGRSFGVVKYDLSTSKYSLHALPPDGAIGWDHVSDYSSTVDGVLFFRWVGSSLEVYETSSSTGQAPTLMWTCTSTGLVQPGAEAPEGIVVRWITGWKFAVLYKQGDTLLHSIHVYDHSPGLAASARFSAVALPAGISLSAGGNLAIAADRSGNRLFLCEFRTSAIPRFYVCTFDALGTWTELTFTNTPSASTGAYHPSTGAFGREPLVYWNNQLILMGYSTGGYGLGQLLFWRVVLDGGLAP